MILAVLLGFAAILGVGLFAYQGTSIAPGLIDGFMAPVMLTVEKAFTVLGYMAPFLVAVVPLYLVMNGKSMGRDRMRMMVYASLYGLGLFAVAIYTGMDVYLTQALRGSWMVGSTLGLAVSTLGAAAEWIIGLFLGVALWGFGFILVLLDSALDALVGVGEAARYGRGGVRVAQRKVMDSIGGRGR